MLQGLLKKVGVGVLALVAGAASVAICLVAFGFMTYAVLSDILSPAQSAAATAALFAILAVLFAMLAKGVRKGGRHPAPKGLELHPETLRVGSQALLAAVDLARTASRLRGGKKAHADKRKHKS